MKIVRSTVIAVIFGLSSLVCGCTDAPSVDKSTAPEVTPQDSKANVNQGPGPVPPGAKGGGRIPAPKK